MPPCHEFTQVPLKCHAKLQRGSSPKRKLRHSIYGCSYPPNQHTPASSKLKDKSQKIPTRIRKNQVERTSLINEGARLGDQVKTQRLSHESSPSAQPQCSPSCGRVGSALSQTAFVHGKERGNVFPHICILTLPTGLAFTFSQD